MRKFLRRKMAGWPWTGRFAILAIIWRYRVVLTLLTGKEMLATMSQQPEPFGSGFIFALQAVSPRSVCLLTPYDTTHTHPQA